MACKITIAAFSPAIDTFTKLLFAFRFCVRSHYETFDLPIWSLWIDSSNGFLTGLACTHFHIMWLCLQLSIVFGYQTKAISLSTNMVWAWRLLWFCVEQMEVCYPHFCIIQLSLQIKISSYCSKTELRILLETFIRNSALRRHSILRLEHSLQLQWSHSFNEKLKQLRISCNSALLKEESFCKQKVQN